MGNTNSAGANDDVRAVRNGHSTGPAVKMETKEETGGGIISRSLQSGTQQGISGSDPAKSANAKQSEVVPDEKFDIVGCKDEELNIGDMRHVSVPGRKQQILLGRDYDGRPFALSNACTHYNALLKNGVLGVGRIRCPWHGATFCTRTGDIEEFPCNDALNVFEVETANGEVRIKGEGRLVDEQRRVPVMSKWNKDPDAKIAVIVGSGPAALICAETLRKEKFDGRIVMMTDEKSPPYDRPKLSKVLDATIDKIQLRKDDFLKTYDIEVRCNAKVASIDVDNKNIVVEGNNSEKQKFDYLVIATGQGVRRLPITETRIAWKNIYYLRTLTDANAIAAVGKGQNVVILGSSFIGMECAAFFADKAATVTVISRTRVPFQQVFGPEVGEALRTELFDKKKVMFLPNIDGIKEYIGDEKQQHLKKLRLSDGTTVDVDVFIVGIGASPNTDFLKDSKLALNERTRALMVDECMRTNVDGIFGAGDVVEFPLGLFGNPRVTIGHWNLAHSLGRTAALSIVGKPKPTKVVPYFWTQLFAKSVRYAGFAHKFDDVYIHGSLNALKFVAYYLVKEKVVAAASVMYDPVVSRFAELLMNDVTVTLENIKEDPELTQLADRTFRAAA